MYIHRAKALLLVGTISAGCASNDDDGPGNAGAAGAAGSGGSGGSSQGGGGAGGAGTGGTASNGGSGQGGGGAGGSAASGGSGQGDADAGQLDELPDTGLDAGNSDVPDAAGDAGGTLTCDDTADTLVNCDDLGQTECVGLESFLSSECEMLAFNLKPAATNAARNCMIALEPPELCDTANTYDCIAAALASSCPDAAADDDCATIGDACDDSSPALSACSAALSGMTQSGRDQMVACMTTDLCDLYSCIEGLQIL